MVLDFLRRRKRVTGKNILTCPDTHGHYKRKGEWEDWDPEETLQTNTTTEAELDYTRTKKRDFTWDTLRRLRRHSSHSRSLYQLSKVHQNNDITGSIGFLPQLSTISDVPPEASTNSGSDYWEEDSFLANGRSDDMYKSSPNLCQSSERCSNAGNNIRPHSWLDSNDLMISHLEDHENRQSTPSVLKFTRWERNNSLITLEIDSPGNDYPAMRKKLRSKET